MSDRTPPPTVRRIFAREANVDQMIAETPAYLIGRLLEEGNSNDLVWLNQVFSEDQIGSWLQTRGSRQLSRRSRLFWSAVLDREVSDPPGLHAKLWPL